ncbi:MAG: hypothetical protein ACRC2O_09010 [Chitinophagaceae bacterium]
MINQNLTNNEVKVERLTTGTTHPYLGAIPTKGTIPLPKTLTGTITTDNAGTSAGLIVIGVGTIFFTEVYPGDFIYDNDAAVRKVKAVFSNTMLQLEEKFPASVSGIALKVPKRSYYKSITSRSSGTVDAELQEATFAFGSSTVTGGSPLAYDASTLNSEIEFTCSK